MCEGIRHLRVTGEYMKIVLVQHPFDNVNTIQYNISGTRTRYFKCTRDPRMYQNTQFLYA